VPCGRWAREGRTGASGVDGESERRAGARQMRCELISPSPRLRDAHERCFDHGGARKTRGRSGPSPTQQPGDVFGAPANLQPKKLLASLSARPRLSARSSCIHFEQTHTIWSRENERRAHLAWHDRQTRHGWRSVPPVVPPWVCARAHGVGLEASPGRREKRALAPWRAEQPSGQRQRWVSIDVDGAAAHLYVDPPSWFRPCGSVFVR
jgi:hypothetical protein